MTAIEAAAWPSQQPNPTYPPAPTTASPPDDVASAPATPSLASVLAAIGSMVLVATAAAIGAADGATLLRATGAVAAPTLGALLLTAPALVALHQFLGLAAPPHRLVGALAHGLVSSGKVSLGLVPIALFFAATSTRWYLTLAAVIATSGMAMAAVATVELRAAETKALVMPPRFALLLVGWCVLGVLIALRIMISMDHYIVAGVSP